MRSRLHRRVLTGALCECAALEIRRTEMETASTCDSLEFGDFSTAHFAISGTPVFPTPHQAANLMPADSIIFTDERRYTIFDGAPSHSVILSFLFEDVR